MKFRIAINIIIIALSVKIIHGESKKTNENYRLSPHENTMRLGSCGDWPGENLWNAEILTPENYGKWEKNREKVTWATKMPGTTTVAATTVTGGTDTTTEQVSTDGTTTQPGIVNQLAAAGSGSSLSTGSSTANSNASISASTVSIPTSTAVLFESYEVEPAIFVSQHHIMTSSGFLIHKKDSTWHYNQDGKPLDVSGCVGNNGSLLLDGSGLKVIDMKNQVREVRQIAFLNFCEFQKNSYHVLTLITVSKARIPVPVICLAKWNTKVDIGDAIEWYSKTEKKTELQIKSCKGSDNRSPFICSSVKSCEPSIIVKRERAETDYVVGVGTADKESCGKNEIHQDYHNIKTHIDEICTLFGFCGRQRKSVYPGSERDEEVESIEDDYLDIIPEPEFFSLYKDSVSKKWWIPIGILAVLSQVV